jgi:hypothetical protein
MSEKMINRAVALGVFLVTLFVYMKTLSVTVVFWDVGEFCASSFLLQVPHPPGSPLFILLARIVSLVPFLPDIAARMHAISAVGSAVTIAFMYLIGVKLISRFHGTPSTGFDRLVVYGSSVIGSLALAFSTTFWDNAIEAEVYGLSMFFVAFIMWLALRWWERADEPHNEKYMLLIAYLIGLSVGIHLLALLAVFSVLMLVYFRRYEVNRKSFIRFGLIAVVIFFVIYPGVVQFLPSMLDGDFKGMKSDLLPFIPPLFIIAAIYGAYKATQTKHKMLYMACLSFLLIVLGYTTYIMVLQRANVDNLPMKENNPNNLERLTGYLTREQYGDTPLLKGESWDNDLQDYREKLFPRRHSHESMHEATRVNYTSDGDFLWRYQINHMFTRYVLWNFVGSEGDWQDAGVSWKETWGIPLFLALFGIYYHFKKDWKMALTFFVMFIIMGIVLDLYQNQQDPQPRERDYFYVGAYFTLALWIAIGIIGIIDFLRTLLTQPGTFRTATIGVLAIGVFAVPVSLVRMNWFEHDRSQNYTAWDYSYNLLQSCEQDAILFTNGDNDTFPVWYLQDVEGVRRDVRVVNLSLVNTSWYILQLKNEMPHGTKKVAISFSDQQIERISPVRWNPRQLDLPVPHDVAVRFGVTDSTTLRQGKITFSMQGIPIQEGIRILRAQDIMVRDIIMMNKWERPIFFAATVSPDSKIGLDNYMWMRGLGYKLKPIRSDAPDGGLDRDIMEANVLTKNVVPSKTPQNGFLYRNLNNPNVYYDENVQRLAMNYRAAFMRLTFEAMRENNREKAKKIMAQLEETIPLKVLPIRDWVFTARMMSIYNQLGDSVNFELYSKNVETACLDLIDANRADLSSDDNPYRYLLEIYDARKNYQASLDLLNRVSASYPNDAGLKSRIQFYEQRLKGSASTDSAKLK